MSFKRPQRRFYFMFAYLFDNSFVFRWIVAKTNPKKRHMNTLTLEKILYVYRSLEDFPREDVHNMAKRTKHVLQCRYCKTY